MDQIRKRLLQDACFQREYVRRNIEGVTHMRLAIVPNKGGSGRAKLTSLRLFA